MGIPEGLFVAKEPLVCYPDHELAYQCFYENSGQWRSGGGGPYALDYGVLYTWLDAEGVKKRDRNRVIREVAHIERGALEVMQERREQQERSRKK